MFKALFFAPILFLLVLFALSNPQVVHLTMWPTDVVVDLPLSITVLISMAVSLVLGSVMLWISVVGARFRARRAESQVRMLEEQIEGLRAKLARAEMKPVQAPMITLPANAVVATQKSA